MLQTISCWEAAPGYPILAICVERFISRLPVSLSLRSAHAEFERYVYHHFSDMDSPLHWQRGRGDVHLGGATLQDVPRWDPCPNPTHLIDRTFPLE